MSCVTVKVPCAPAPLACMRRSGMTSRSKCASFSINQRSCSSAGPRGPAVRMFRLSVTGVPVACVKCWRFFSSDTVVLLRSSGVSAWPGGPADDIAEIRPVKMRILIREDVGLDVAEGRIRLVLDALVESLDDVFFEVLRTRMGLHDRLALDVAVFAISQPEDV